MTDLCAMCGAATDDPVMISRCCCSSDAICRACLQTVTLADYVAKCVVLT